MQIAHQLPPRLRHPQLQRLARTLLAVCCLALLPLHSAHAQPPARHLLIYAIDVEGGQSTLIVSPSGASLLIDTGWPSIDPQSTDPIQQGLVKSGMPAQTARDATRIQAAMRDAGITRIDHLLITHFHVDHVGGVPELVKRVPIGEFIDHGPNREDSDITRHDYAAYLKAIQGKPRRIVHPGDTINIPGLSAIVLTADGEHIAAVPGVRPTPNPYCAAEPHWDLDTTENPRSAGVLITYGKFRFLDLGDLTKAKEIPLVCPNNLIGAIDLYLVNHHGFNLSNSKAFVDAIHPRVAIMDNGAHKAGSPEAWQTVHESPGLEDLWMLHTAEDSDPAHNSPEPLIANLKGGPDGEYLKVVVSRDGTFSITNPRTSKTKVYAAK
ncbi:MAG: MBL fold metallo-hydrolase [Terracidiphilus sp.]|jgi:beta-lactamase superfamily II metal-dependent hydrolase